MHPLFHAVLSLTFNGQIAVGERHGHVLLRHAWEIRLDNDGVVALAHIEVRH